MPRPSKAEVSVILLVFTLILTVVALFNQSQRASDEVIDRAFSSAKDLLTFVTTVQRKYIEMVAQIPVDEMTTFPEKHSDRIWLPATFARSYIEDYSVANPKVDFRLYSRDPFIFNRDRVLDDFANAALDALLPGGVSSYRSIEELGDGYRLARFAAAFPMNDNCVACHNHPKWGLEKQDWKAGDVRGIWEASIVVPPTNLYSQAELFGLFTFVSIACFLSAFVVWPAVRTEVRKRSFFHDRSIRMEKRAELKSREAMTDALTQIGNRRYFDAIFKPMVEECSSGDGTLSSLIFDIDNFKKVNDSYGHGAGDLVIKSVAELLRKHTRREDKLARLGGEEFVILVPNLQPDAVMKIANRIKNQLEAHMFNAGNLGFKVTISAGVAHLIRNEKAEDLLKRADTQLYRAKQTGRNKICEAFTRESAT